MSSTTLPQLHREARLAFFHAGTSLTRWSRERGYRPGTVLELIRYAARAPGYVPRGKLAVAIAADLERDLGLELVQDAPRT